MSALAVLSKAIALIEAGQSAAALAARAMEAANNGDQAASDAYLEQAREKYAEARKEWDNA